jgi:hypothetical protein
MTLIGGLAQYRYDVDADVLVPPLLHRQLPSRLCASFHNSLNSQLSPNSNGFHSTKADVLMNEIGAPSAPVLVTLSSIEVKAEVFPYHILLPEKDRNRLLCDINKANSSAYSILIKAMFL